MSLTSSTRALSLQRAKREPVPRGPLLEAASVGLIVRTRRGRDDRVGECREKSRRRRDDLGESRRVVMVSLGEKECFFNRKTPSIATE